MKNKYDVEHELGVAMLKGILLALFICLIALIAIAINNYDIFLEAIYR